MIPVHPHLLAPGPDEARRLLEEELAGAAYVEAQPNVFERILTDVLLSLGRLLDGVTGLGAGPGTLVVALGAAVIVIVAIVLIKPRLNARGRKPEAALFDGATRRTSDEHRSRAADHAGRQDWNVAVAELLRAIIRAAEERVVLDEQPGRTATEAGSQLGDAFPGLRADIRWLTDHFDETHYGSGRASDEDYSRAASLDERLTAEQPSRSAPTTSPAAPR